jgi:hypothetical protein
MFAIDPPSDPCGDARRRIAAFDALNDAVDWAYGGISLSRSRRRSRFVGAEAHVGLSDVLADPIVRALMAADGTDRDGVEAMMRGVATRLASRKPAALRGCMNKGV